MLPIFVALCLLSAPAYAFWIWTPKTGRWINPKDSVKPTPKEQLRYAMDFYELGQYKEAMQEFKALLKYYPKSYEASEAQYYIGLTYEGTHELYEAFRAYQRVIDKYPFSTRVDEIIEREVKIGEAFLAGEKRKALGVYLPLENPAIEIFRRVVDNSKYGKNAARAQYLLAMALKSEGRFQEARDEFDKCVTTYPESEWPAQAQLQAADSANKMAPKADYDQELTKEAKSKLEEIIQSGTDEKLTTEAKRQMVNLNEKEAESNLGIAEFYQRQKKFDAAKIYYQDIVDSCPNCSSAIKAREKLKELEKNTDAQK